MGVKERRYAGINRAISDITKFYAEHARLPKIKSKNTDERRLASRMHGYVLLTGPHFSHEVRELVDNLGYGTLHKVTIKQLQDFYDLHNRFPLISKDGTEEETTLGRALQTAHNETSYRHNYKSYVEIREWAESLGYFRYKIGVLDLITGERYTFNSLRAAARALPIHRAIPLSLNAPIYTTKNKHQVFLCDNEGNFLVPKN